MKSEDRGFFRFGNNLKPVSINRCYRIQVSGLAGCNLLNLKPANL